MSNDARRPCPACLDSRACWVCDGTGALHLPAGTQSCRACESVGRCQACAPLPVQRTGSAPVHLDA